MKTPREVALELWVSMQNVRLREVDEFAKTVSSDPEFVRDVVREYSRLKTNAANLRAAADRNMPD